MRVAMMCNPAQLGNADGPHEQVDREQIPTLGNDDQRVPGPNDARGCQHTALPQAQLLGWSGRIADA